MEEFYFTTENKLNSAFCMVLFRCTLIHMLVYSVTKHQRKRSALLAIMSTGVQHKVVMTQSPCVCSTDTAECILIMFSGKLTS